MNNSKRKGVLNPKFLSVLSLAGIAVFFTSEPTNAMFKNPRTQMPLAKSSSGKPITLPKTYGPISYVIDNDERNSLLPSSSTSSSLRTLGDGINTNTTTSNIGTGLRQAGDRFTNNQ